MTSTTVQQARTGTAAASARSGRGRVLSHSLTIARRNLIQVVRTPELLVFSAVQPIIFVLLFNYVFGGAIQTPGVEYIDFLIPGIVVMTVAFASFGTGIGLNEDLAKGMVDRFRSLPIARSAYLTGRILADTARIMGNVLLLAGVGVLLGLRFHAGPVPALGAFLLATAFGVAMAWVAALIGLAARNPETVNSVGFIWMLPLVFASSAFVPVASMPGWLQAFAEVNPITVNVDALRALVLGGPTATPVVQSLAWIGGITVVFWVLAVRRYRRIA
jgi:ABC transporter DrrB family efflux protein